MIGTAQATTTVIVRLDRTIQYAVLLRSIAFAGGYWMPAFAGMTMEIWETDQ